MIKQSHYRTPRNLSECRWNPHMAPIEKSFRPHKSVRFDRWLKLLSLLAILLCLAALSGCDQPMHNDQIIVEVKKCREAGLVPRLYSHTWEPGVTSVVCAVPR